MLPTLFRQTGLRPIDSLTRDFDRMIGQIWNRNQDGNHDGNADQGGGVLGVYPVDIREDENHVFVEAELPGFKKDEINVTLENGVLRIQAERTVEKTQDSDATEKATSRHLSERRYTRFARSFTLPKDVDENKVDAKLDHGVLHLTLHKREEVKPHRIEVK